MHPLSQEAASKIKNVLIFPYPSISQGEKFQSGTVENIYGLRRFIDNRIAVQIKRRIQDDSFAGNWLLIFKEPIKSRIPASRNFLRLEPNDHYGLLAGYIVGTRFRARIERESKTGLWAPN
jgi:hypothetical protein